VLISVEPEHRSGAEQPAQIGLDVAELFGAGREDLFGQLRVTDDAAGKLAPRYVSADLGVLRVRAQEGATIFDFGKSTPRIHLPPAN